MTLTSLLHGQFANVLVALVWLVPRAVWLELIQVLSVCIMF